MNIAIIGAGDVCAALGKALTRGGYAIQYCAPTPEEPKYADQKAAFGDQASFHPPAEAVLTTKKPCRHWNSWPSFTQECAEQAVFTELNQAAITQES